MKNLLLVITVLLFSSCASFQLSTLNNNPAYSIDGSDVDVKVIKNEFELARLLRDDFNFRYDFAQYALSQPQSFDWRFNRMNRFMGMNRYGYNQYSIFGTNTWGYSNMWNRSQMWNDWVWGYPYGNGMGWSYSWGNNSWSSNSWNNPYGWNNWNGWGNGYGHNAWHQLGGIYGRQQNVAYNRGRRGSNNVISRNIQNNIVVSNSKPRIINNKPLKEDLVIKDLNQYYIDLIKNGNGKEIKVYTNPNNVPKIIRNTNTNNNNVRIYNRPPVINNSNNNRNVIPRPTRTVVIKSASSSRSNNTRSNNTRIKNK